VVQSLSRRTYTQPTWVQLPLVPVMWSETVDIVGQDRSETKKIGLGQLVLYAVVLVLVLQVWYCLVKNDLVTLVVIMILKDTATFQVLFIVSLFCLGTSLLWRSTVAFTYLKLNPPSAFVYFRWSWSCYFGLGLKNLSCLHHWLVLI